jgi:Transposase
VTRYSPEIRFRAVHMVLDDGLAVKAVASELGIGASTLSSWVRAVRRRRREQWWADQVTPVFAFLNDYGFVLTEVRAGDWWETAAVYRAEQAAVEEVHGVGFWRVELRLMLVRAYSDAKKLRKIAHSQYGLEANQVAAALDFWARILREGSAYVSPRPSGRFLRDAGTAERDML